MLLNYGKQYVALFLAGSANVYPNYFMLGSGSGTAVATQTALIAPWDRQAVTGTNGSTVYKVTWQGDWNSVEISGLQLREFAMAGSASALAGSIWSRTALPNLIFDGTNELRIEETWVVY